MYFRKDSLYLVLIALILFLTVGPSFGQPKNIEDKKPQAEIKKGEEPTITKEQMERKGGLCACLQPAIDVVQKAYTSLEEDEWPTAIKICKDAITLVKNLSLTCKCPEIESYKKLSEAYLKYAEGGNHLDGAETPNCPYAKKLYSDGIKLIDESLSKVTRAEVKAGAGNIREYLEEEQQFVDEECGETQESKPQGAGESKKNKN